MSLAVLKSYRPSFFFGSQHSAMFCATVNEPTSLKCWCTMPTPMEMAWDGLCFSTFFPFT